MEDKREPRSCVEKRALGDSGVANKKQRTEDYSSVAQLQHINSSDGEESEADTQLVLYKNDRQNRSKRELHYLMVKNICKKCTAISLYSRQPERVIHIIFENEAATKLFVQPLIASDFIEVDQSGNIFYFAAARNCIVTASWLHDLDHENDVHGYLSGLERLSNNRESSAVVLLSGKAANKRTESGQAVPIGSLLFSSDGSRTSLGGCPTFKTYYHDHLNKLLQDLTKPNVLFKDHLSAVCVDTSQGVPLNKQCSVVVDKHPIFLRKLLEHFNPHALRVMVAINEQMEQCGVMDQKAMCNAITLLHTFLAAGIDTVFPEVGPITTTRDLVRRERTETAYSQPINNAYTDHTNPAIKFPSGATYQLPETPDSNRQVCTTKDISPSVEPALDSPRTLTDLLLKSELLK
ncbi:PREDICTED: uncharacterized protein LOC109485234 [Branchiostoma belcheri]|uniref:Uncharacterized protein LOC109485234 n=1 Tax=Branchiostoma belcheri TaxID=7741 RepID=A0A6P5A466_BRABE|nr:PREDICTED: uncharacterized protein LOC109485234 [Branchiostoma belcheri]